MQNTTEQVDTLKEKLVITMEHVGVEKEKTDALILVAIEKPPRLPRKKKPLKKSKTRPT